MRFALVPVLLALSLGALPSAASAQAPDWAALAEPDVVEIVTNDADGDSRQTKVWVVVRDGHLYLRTVGTRWHANLERDPTALLISGERRLSVRNEAVTDEATKDAVVESFHLKYGFKDTLRNLVVFGGPNIWRLAAAGEQ